MGKRVKYDWQTLRPSIEKRIEEGENVQSLARRYGVATRTIERALKELGLETFQQRFQRITAKKKNGG